MPANIEIKARVGNIDELEKIVQQLADGDATILKQKDTFYNVPNGRLKLREMEHRPFAQLIFYERSDDTGPKQSDFWITEEHNPEQLKVTLGKALGVKGCVEKTRMLYMIGQTRVHLDRVVGLGSFMELEVQLMEDQTGKYGQSIADDLMNKLSIQEADLLSGSYMDLLHNM